MHGWETRMLLRHYLQRGVSKAALARRFGVSRRTIHEWVETGQLDRDLSSGGARYSPRPAVPHKLAPYTGIIEARLEEFPGLSAQRLFDEVRAAGYPGGYSRVRDYVRAVRPGDEREALGPLARRPYQRFGVQPATEPTRRRVPDTVKVERRSLRVYAEAAG